MSTGGELYLALVIGGMSTFALVLAYFTAQQAKFNRAKQATAGTRAGAPVGVSGMPSHA